MLISVDELAQRVRVWAALELERGRAFLFLPVAFGCGILAYFAAPDEPTLAGPLFLTAILAGLAYRMRFHYGACLILAMTATLSAGFLVGVLRSAWMAHPILGTEVSYVRLTAWVEAVERREGGDRLTLLLIKAEPALPVAIERFRATARAASGVRTGSAVSLAARLRPPADPAAPGLFDFGRDAFYAGIGATGFVIGQVSAFDAGEAPRSIRLRAALDRLRSAISDRIRGAIPGPAGAIADALVTGKRDGIPEGLNEAMRAAGTYHILSISGFHMALVAALVFALVRGSLALFPAFALRRRVKALAALVALAVSTAYLVISGAEVATQRSWIMIAVVLIGVALDRGALTLRTLALAALVVLVLSPESIIGPSFQMSFAATLALVTGYGMLRPWAERHAENRTGGGRLLLSLTNGIAGLATSSFVASLATTPYSAYHFNTLQLYGVAGNLLGAPIIEFVVMPLEILALLLWPFGFDQPVWSLVGTAIQLFVRLMEWVASWPGGRIVVPSFTPLALALMSAGIILAALLTTPLRWAGVPLFLAGLCVIPLRDPPDILIDAEGGSVAIRGSDGRLRAVSPRGNRFTLQRWLLSDGDARQPADNTIRSGVTCDPQGCGALLAGGDRIVVTTDPEGLADDCREARFLVTRMPVPRPCAASVIALRALAWTGAVSFHKAKDGYRIELARPTGGIRPWHRPRPPGAMPPLLSPPTTMETAAAPPTIPETPVEDVDPAHQDQ
jgi:competence protein ComEC